MNLFFYLFLKAYLLNLTVVLSSGRCLTQYWLGYPICLYSIWILSIPKCLPNCLPHLQLRSASLLGFLIREPCVSLPRSQLLHFPITMRVFCLRIPTLPSRISANQNENLDKRKSFPRRIACVVVWWSTSIKLLTVNDGFFAPRWKNCLGLR